MADFGDKCLVLKDKALKHFDDETSHYKQSVYEKIRGEVIKEIFQSLLTCFDQQLNFASKKIYADFDIQIKGLTKKKDAVNDSFHKQSTALVKDLLNDFSKVSTSLIIEGSGWEERVQQQNEELKRQLWQQVQHIREKEIGKLKSLTLKATFETIDEIVNEPCYQVDDDFWELINGAL